MQPSQKAVYSTLHHCFAGEVFSNVLKSNDSDNNDSKKSFEKSVVAAGSKVPNGEHPGAWVAVGSAAINDLRAIAVRLLSLLSTG